MTSFHWHPYWSHFIRSLRNVRLNKINERTYQDGTGVVLVVDKERGVFRTYTCTYHREKEKDNSSHTDKWVINLSKTPLTQEQLSLLQKGPNYAITTKYPPIEAYITSTKLAAKKLPSQDADELRSDVNRILKQLQQQHNKQCNLNPSQYKALTELKQDNSMVVLTVDKGVAMVIMDQQDYINKAQTLLQDTNTHRVLPKDPTSHLKNKLITLLKDIKQTGGLSTQKYKQLYPTSAVPPKFYGLPKIHKAGTP